MGHANFNNVGITCSVGQPDFINKTIMEVSCVKLSVNFKVENVMMSSMGTVFELHPFLLIGLDLKGVLLCLPYLFLSGGTNKF